MKSASNYTLIAIVAFTISLPSHNGRLVQAALREVTFKFTLGVMEISLILKSIHELLLRGSKFFTMKHFVITNQIRIGIQ